DDDGGGVAWRGVATAGDGGGEWRRVR
ncbi:hypothetical protein Tco_0736940, partial [Tanacetum coccineum]